MEVYSIRIYLVSQIADQVSLIAYFGEIGHLFGMKTAGCPVKSATPNFVSGAGLRYQFNSVYSLFQLPPSYRSS
jgi:hypothetical protein